MNEYTRNNRRIGRVVFNVARARIRESRRLVLSSFRDAVFFRIPDDGQGPKTQKSRMKTRPTVYFTTYSMKPLFLSSDGEVLGIKKTNSVALVRERTMTTERPPLVGEVSANFCG
jgi:hypothetical protein